MVVQGAAVGPVFARRRCRTEPASSHSERRSSSPLALPPAKQVPGGFSMLTETCMQRGESRAAVMVMQGAAVGPVLKVAARQRRDDCELELGEKRRLERNSFVHHVATKIIPEAHRNEVGCRRFSSESQQT